MNSRLCPHKANISSGKGPSAAAASWKRPGYTERLAELNQPKVEWEKQGNRLPSSWELTSLSLNTPGHQKGTALHASFAPGKRALSRRKTSDYTTRSSHRTHGVSLFSVLPLTCERKLKISGSHWLHGEPGGCEGHAGSAPCRTGAVLHLGRAPGVGSSPPAPLYRFHFQLLSPLSLPAVLNAAALSLFPLV